jgi:shikimate dehydrogenase
MITANSRIAGLIGHPIAHSLSPQLHNHLYASLGLDMMYLAFDVKPDQLHAAVEGMLALGFVGFNITKPYKERIVDILDIIDPEAAIIGAVNTVKIQNGKLHGYNTDGPGLIEALKRENIEVEHKNVLVLGAGGSARSAGIYLAKENPASIRIWNRTPERAVILSDLINNYMDSVRAVPVIDIPSDVDEVNGILLVTADHGNADEMYEKAKGTEPPKSKTAHTLNPVPFIVYDRQVAHELKDGAFGLANVAPTIATLLGIEKPEMWEECMIVK